MHYKNLDAYYYLASQGDREAYYELYRGFKKRAYALIRLTLYQMTNFTENPVDFSDFIDTTFFRAINEYGKEKGSFTYYIDYILKVRIPAKLQTEIVDYSNLYAQCDFRSDEAKAIELMADPNQQSMQSEVARSRFKASISSSMRTMSNVEKLRNKILLLQYAGYNNREISRKLNIPLGELRGHLDKIKKDRRVVNLKLEMK